MRGVDLPCTSAHWPWEGWGAATDARPAAAPRPVLKCASAQGGAAWRTRRQPFQGWKVLVKLVFWALKPRQPAPTPENVGPPPKLGPPPVPVTTTYVLPLYLKQLRYLVLESEPRVSAVSERRLKGSVDGVWTA